MRVIFLVVASTLSAALALSAAATSDRRMALTDSEAMIRWEKLMAVTSGTNEGEVVEHLLSLGIGEDGAKALKDLRARGLAELQRVGNQFYLDVCRKQQEMRDSGGPELVAQLVERSIHQEADARRRLITEAYGLLTVQDQERLEHLLSSDQGPKVALTETNIAMRVRNGEISVEQAIAAACELSNKEP